MTAVLNTNLAPLTVTCLQPPFSFPVYTTLMCRSHAMYCKSSACRTYPSSFTPFVIIIWITLYCGDCELEMGLWSWDHLSPSILGTVLPQWARLIGMQQGLSLSLPLAFSPCLSFCSAWNRHSDEKPRGPKCLWRQGTYKNTHTNAHTHTYSLSTYGHVCAVHTQILKCAFG